MINKLMILAIVAILAAPAILATENEYIVLLRDSQESFDIDDFDERQDAITENQEILLAQKDFKRAIESGSGVKIRNKYENVNAISITASEEYVSRLKSNPSVKRVYKPLEVHATLEQSAGIVNATQAWNVDSFGQKITGKGQTVCVVDSGIDYTHQAFGSCTKSQFLAGQCAKVLGGFDFINGDNDPMDDAGHGTHVSGIIASSHMTYKGIAHGASIVSAKVLDSFGGGTTETVVAGIDWCISNADRYNISVISMSLGTFFTSTQYCDNEEPAITQAINTATSRNIAVVAASGNGFDDNGISLPACIRNAVSVGSTEKDDTISFFSNRDDLLDLMAPGGQIVSSVPDFLCPPCVIQGFEAFDGTSMATPHVSAAFALLRQFSVAEKGKVLAVEEYKSFLAQTGKRITDQSTGRTYPRINILSALIQLNASFPSIIPPEPEVEGIEISDIDAEVDGKKSSISSSLEIRKKAKPGSEIELEITVRNFGSFDIEEASISGEVDDIDGMEDESSDFSIMARGTKKSKLTFTVPEDIEEDTYRIELEIEAEDENGEEYILEKRVKFEVEKENHALEITKLSLIPSSLACSRKSSLSYEIENRGTEDSDAEILIYEPGLSFEKAEEAMIADETFSRNAPLSFDDYSPGDYEIIVEAHSEGKLMDRKSVPLKISECTRKPGSDDRVVAFLGSGNGEEGSAQAQATMRNPASHARQVQKIEISDEAKVLGGLGAIAIMMVSLVFFLYLAKK
jgi:subtilisin family serine protease